MIHKNYKKEFSNYLGLLPKAWQDKLGEALLNYVNEFNDVKCSDIQNCFASTNLTDFSTNGTQVCFSFTDKDDVTVTRCFDFQDILNNYINDVDPQCLATWEDWQSASWAQKWQLIIDAYCDKVCEDPTTTTTTTTTSSTTTTTTVDPYDYYLADQRSCDDCGTIDQEDVRVKFLAGTGVILGNFYTPTPTDGNSYELLSPTVPGSAVDLSNSMHNTSCVSICGSPTTTTTTTTTTSSTTTTTTLSNLQCPVECCTWDFTNNTGVSQTITYIGATDGFTHSYVLFDGESVSIQAAEIISAGALTIDAPTTGCSTTTTTTTALCPITAKFISTSHGFNDTGCEDLWYYVKLYDNSNNPFVNTTGSPIVVNVTAHYVVGDCYSPSSTFDVTSDLHIPNGSSLSSDYFAATASNNIVIGLEINTITPSTASGCSIEAGADVTTTTTTTSTTTSSTTTTTTDTTTTTTSTTTTTTAAPTGCTEYMNNTGSDITGVNYTDCDGNVHTLETVAPGGSICMQDGTGGGNFGFLIILGPCSTTTTTTIA